MWILVFAIHGVWSSEDGQAIYDKAMRHFSSSEYQEAINLFGKAIDLEPENTKYYFGRLITYKALNRFQPMMRDLNKIVQINPHQKTALNYRAELNRKFGNLDDSEADYKTLEADGEKVTEELKKIQEIKASLKAAVKSSSNNQHDAVISSLETLIKNCPLDVKLYEMRMESYKAKNQMEKVVSDARQISSLVPEDPQHILRLVLLISETGESEQALREVKQCLRIDPDHSACMEQYKLLKRLDKLWTAVENSKSNSDWPKCLDLVNNMARNYNKGVLLRGKKTSCECESKDAQTAKEAIKSCSEVLQDDPKDVSYLFFRGEAHLLLGDFDKAESDLQKVKRNNPEYPGIDDSLQRCQKMKKQASKRDYYKILGLERSATKADVVKAYRNLAKLWHPDRYSGADKDLADSKFRDIADAKEVLSNPEMRRKFDSGIDPLDETAESQNHGFHGGFPGGFHGGFPGGFRFNFNDGFPGGDQFFFNF